ncbi:MAG: hypothetical protein J6N70_06175, partial [Oribacterium sp.]|nr:hypothetical protein [Oribacterium sp.]
LAKEMEKRNENTLLAKVDDDRTRMTIAKRNTEMLDEIMDEMRTASEYVHKHNLYPTGWSNIMRTYNELKQQEKQQSIETPETPKPTTPAKSTHKFSL